MNNFARAVLLSVLALGLHLALGWGWTILAGLAAGLWIGNGGWHLGAVSVGLEWLIVVVYNYIVDAGAVHLMTQTVGSIFGNMPFFVVVALTLLIGLLLGGLGGAAGTQLYHLFHKHEGAQHSVA